MAFENLSPEAVALVLTKDIIGRMASKPDQKAFLDLYAECLMAVRQPADRAPNYKE